MYYLILCWLIKKNYLLFEGMVKKDVIIILDLYEFNVKIEFLMVI